MERWLPLVRGLLFVGYPGQEGGQAIAEVLLGRVNPSGKLPATFEKRLEDRSSFHFYHDDDHDLRVTLGDGIFSGYRHAEQYDIEPRFCFGFGLSYTRFAYENLRLSTSRLRSDESLIVSFDIVNVGEREGAEVAQLYVRDFEASVPRPKKELKGFTKVKLLPQERKRVELVLGPRAFAFYSVERHDYFVEPGAFEVLVAASSQDVRLKAFVEVV
jgi:beta-glucosidase